MTNVGDSIKADNANWTFEDGVVDTFDDHVSKSIPYYHDNNRLAAQLSDYFLGDGSICYELGCSTGQLISTVADRNQNKDVRFIGVDTVPEMVEAAQEKCAKYPCVTIVNDDIVSMDFEPADLFLSFYTIQFIRPKWRQQTFDKIYNSLNWGGALILLEKVRGADARFQDITTGLYHDYKMSQGYTAEEVVGKARSLKGVLEPFSTQGNLDLMHRAGFEDIMTVFKWACWECFLAIK